MSLSPEIRQHLMEQEVEDFKHIIETLPCTEDLCYRFVKTVHHLMADAPSLDDVQQKQILKVCELVRDRPFPALLWAELIASRVQRSGGNAAAVAFLHRGLNKI